jgi:hypothetical protein
VNTKIAPGTHVKNKKTGTFIGAIPKNQEFLVFTLLGILYFRKDKIVVNQ